VVAACACHNPPLKDCNDCCGFDKWFEDREKFISRPTSESGLVFPTLEAIAIMALPLSRVEEDTRAIKRQTNKAAQTACFWGSKAPKMGAVPDTD
jgi:hypothetical protein